MTELTDVLAYFCARYPARHELSLGRLTKMVYLADWKSAMESGKQVTDVDWQYSEFGPDSSRILEVLKDSRFSTSRTPEFVFPDRRVYEAVGASLPSIPSGDKEWLDFVIDKTKEKLWDEFVRLVFSTYPIYTQSAGAKLDLVALGADWIKVRPSVMRKRAG